MPGGVRTAGRIIGGRAASTGKALTRQAQTTVHPPNQGARTSMYPRLRLRGRRHWPGALVPGVRRKPSLANQAFVVKVGRPARWRSHTAGHELSVTTVGLKVSDLAFVMLSVSMGCRGLIRRVDPSAASLPAQAPAGRSPGHLPQCLWARAPDRQVLTVPGAIPRDADFRQDLCAGNFRLEHLPRGAYTHRKAPPWRGEHPSATFA